MPIHVKSGEIWLRSWRYNIPALGIAATSPLPVWALITKNSNSYTKAKSLHAEALYDVTKAAQYFDDKKKTLGSDNPTRHIVESEKDSATTTSKNPVASCEYYSSNIFMLYTDNDIWAPREDFIFFEKKFSLWNKFNDVKNDGRNDFRESQRPPCDIKYIPGLKHAFPLYQELIDVVMCALQQHYDDASCLDK